MALYWQPRVQAPTLFVVGEHDLPNIDWNDKAYACLRMATKKLVVVPSAADLYDGSGLAALTRHARQWFGRYLARTGSEPQAGQRTNQEFPVSWRRTGIPDANR